MIEDWFSQLVNVFEFTWQIMLPLWAFLGLGSVLVTSLERWQWRMVPNSPVSGALLGIISPIPTINSISMVKEVNRSTVSFLIASLLANPMLLVLIASNLGLFQLYYYLGLVFLVAAVSSMFIKAEIKEIAEVEERVSKQNWLQRFWGHLAFIGFYTLIGAFLAAILRTGLSWTLFNLDILNYIPRFLRGFLVLAAAPFYHCGGTWLPILRELSDLGISAGTVLGFILFGQVTRVGQLLALQAIFPRTAIAGLVVAVAFISLGLAYLI